MTLSKNKMQLPLLLRITAAFLQKNFAVIFTLGAVAGTGRVIQLNGFGETGPRTHLLLEVIIESARILLLVFVIGSASFRNGFKKLRKLFRKRSYRSEYLYQSWNRIRIGWRSLTLNFIVYGAITWSINIMIDQLAYETCLYLKLKQGGFLSPKASEWTIILFFKNLTVIPLTLVFDIMLICWIMGKLQLAEKKPALIP